MTELIKHLHDLLRARLWLQIVVGLVLGIATGLALGPSVGWVSPGRASNIVQWIALPGELFLALIQMIIIPLVLASIIVGIAGHGSSDDTRRLMPPILVYFVITTTVSITIGIGVTLLIEPGSFIDRETVARTIEGGAGAVSDEADGARGAAGSDAGADSGTSADRRGDPSAIERIVAVVPKNPLQAMVRQNMVQVVVFSIIFGTALASVSKEKSAAVIDALEAVQAVCISIVKWVMRIAPLAVFGLIAKVTAEVGLDVLRGLSVYIGTVLAGLALLLVFYLLLVGLAGGRSPIAFISKARDAQLLAFSTSSSASVMPLTMETARRKLGVRPVVSQFVVPLGATINMDGTALYQGAATVFLAQVFGVELTLTTLVMLVVTATGASIGTPGTPGVGIVILATILGDAGIPASGLALIIGVDRILDMSRTAVNVTGDLAACTVMDRLHRRLTAGEKDESSDEADSQERSVGGEASPAPNPG